MMKTLFILFTAILLSSALFISCSNKSKEELCGDPLPVYLHFYLVDKNDSLLIGTKYDPDSIKLTVENKSINLSFDHGSIFFNYQILEEYNHSNYYLFLSKTDSDTINLVVNHKWDGACGPYYGVTTFSYNSTPISHITGLTYKIIKY